MTVHDEDDDDDDDDDDGDDDNIAVEEDGNCEGLGDEDCERSAG